MVHGKYFPAAATLRVKKACKILFILSDYSFTLHRSPGALRSAPRIISLF
jgi:hypothetical protein